MDNNKCQQIGAIIAQMNQINNKLEFFISQTKYSISKQLKDNFISDLKALNHQLNELLNEKS